VGSAAAGGLVGNLTPGAGTPSEPNQFSATYRFLPDDDTIVEAVTNETALGAEDWWSSLSADGERDMHGKTYGELAGEFVVPAWDQMVEKLSDLGPTTLPHEAKLLRKEIGRARDYLDLFAYAYPRGAGFDPWEDLREDLDEGYEAVGAFKDLFDALGVEDPADAEYGMDEVRARRDEVLAWLAKFTAPGRLAFNRFYVERPRKHRLYERKKGDLGQIYWGAAEARPKRSKEGVENLALLERDLLHEASKDYEEIEHVGKITKPDNEEVFHSFRKRLRGTLKVAGYFPRILHKKARDERALIEQAVDRYGLLNDRLIAFHLATRRGQDQRADELEDEINEAWNELKEWQKDEDLDEAIRDFRRKVER
jgi:hypothetical protein